MIRHSDIASKELRSAIRQKNICFGGNAVLKIYGTLSCHSGKKLKKENRVFFSTEREALLEGFRPCGHCLHRQYEKWKQDAI
jgi:methylphosphotriester-DNA--protein-cysteine methyltransferase